MLGETTKQLKLDSSNVNAVDVVQSIVLHVLKGLGIVGTVGITLDFSRVIIKSVVSKLFQMLTAEAIPEIIPILQRGAEQLTQAATQASLQAVTQAAAAGAAVVPVMVAAAGGRARV